MESFGIIPRSKKQSIAKTGLENSTNVVLQILMELFHNFFQSEGKFRKYLEHRNFAKAWVSDKELPSTASKQLFIYSGGKDEARKTPGLIIQVSPPVPEPAYIGYQIEMTRSIRGNNYLCTPFIDNHLVSIRPHTESEQDAQQLAALLGDILTRYIHMIYKNEMYFPEIHAKLTFPFVKSMPETFERSLKRDASGPDMRFVGDYSFIVKYETLCLRELQPPIESIPFHQTIPAFEIIVPGILKLGKPYNVRLSSKYTHLKLYSDNERIVTVVRINPYTYSLHTKNIGKAKLIMIAEGGKYIDKEIEVNMTGR